MGCRSESPPPLGGAELLQQMVAANRAQQDGRSPHAGHSAQPDRGTADAAAQSQPDGGRAEAGVQPDHEQHREPLSGGPVEGLRSEAPHHLGLNQEEAAGIVDEWQSYISGASGRP